MDLLNKAGGYAEGVLGGIVNTGCDLLTGGPRALGKMAGGDFRGGVMTAIDAGGAALNVAAPVQYGVREVGKPLFQKISEPIRNFAAEKGINIPEATGHGCLAEVFRPSAALQQRLDNVMDKLGVDELSREAQSAIVSSPQAYKAIMSGKPGLF